MTPSTPNDDESSGRPVVWQCPACGKRNETTRDACVYCNAPKPASKASESSQQSLTPPPPGLASVFRFLAALEIIGGIILCFMLWPGEASRGYEWRSVAYIPALTWLMAGVISGCLFLAIADVLVYLCEIRDLLKRPRSNHATMERTADRRTLHS